MKLKAISAALVLAAATTSSFAAIDLSGGSAFFGMNNLGAALDTVDTFTFDNLAAGTYQVQASSISFNGVSFDWVKLNGNLTSPTISNGMPSYFTVTTTGTANLGTLVLEIQRDSTGKSSSYGGEISVTAVPEPETYALMLAGLVAVGFISRRRSKV